MSEPVQTSMLDGHPCPTCLGSGRRPNPETGGMKTCRVCEGTGVVMYDPADRSIPF